MGSLGTLATAVVNSTFRAQGFLLDIYTLVGTMENVAETKPDANTVPSLSPPTQLLRIVESLLVMFMMGYTTHQTSTTYLASTSCEICTFLCYAEYTIPHNPCGRHQAREDRPTLPSRQSTLRKSSVI